MLRVPIIAMALAATALSPALAQQTENTGRTPQEEYDRGRAATPMPNQEEINAGGRAGTASLNNQVAAAGAEAQAGNDAAMQTMNTEQQAQYATDRSAYMDALVKHDAAVNRADTRYVRQQNAYAHAMYMWRMQVAACKRGKQRACDAPPPDPSRYY